MPPPSSVVALAVTLPLVLLASAARAPLARAQAADDKTVANALFDDGKRLSAEGLHAEACAKFEASLSMISRLGVRLNLADCLERIGRTATAWVLFTEATAEARDAQDPREAFASERAAALAPRLTRLAIAVDGVDPVAGLEVRRDGAVVTSTSFGVEIPVDPGEHTVEASAPGRRSWSTVVTAASEGEVLRIVVPRLEPSVRPISLRPRPAPPSPAPAATAAASLPAPARSRVRPALTWAAAATGIVGVGAGSGFGLWAWSRWQDARAQCADGACHDQPLRDTIAARRLGNLSTAAFAIGGASLGAALVLHLLSDDAPRPRAHALRLTPAASAEAVTFTLEGNF